MKKPVAVDMNGETFTDGRGWVINPLDSAGLPAQNLHFLHAASLRPGHVRGNHYHTGAIEWLVVMNGPATIYWRMRETSETGTFSIDVDTPVMVELPPDVEHAVTNDGDYDIFLISFSDSEKRETVRTEPLADPDS